MDTSIITVDVLHMKHIQFTKECRAASYKNAIIYIKGNCFGGIGSAKELTKERV